MSEADARDIIRKAVEVGPWPVPALRALVLESGITGYQLRQAVSSLTRSGELAVLQPRFWIHPSFDNGDRRCVYWVEGHSREQLVARATFRARQSQPLNVSGVERMMQGDDADRLAREEFSRGHD